MFGPRHTAGVVLARDQPPNTITAIAIAVIRGAAVHGDLSRFLQPSQHTIVGNVAEEKVSAVADPHWTFCPAGTRVQALHRRADDSIFCEPRINDLYRRIGIRSEERRVGKEG